MEETAHRLYLRATESHSQVLELMGDEKGVHHVAFEVSDDPELDRSAEILRKQGVSIVIWAVERDVEPGIGRLLRFRDPERNMIELVSEVTDIPNGYEGGPVKPLSLNHVVLYSGDLSKQEDFYVRVLGMRVTDTAPGLLTFLRCNPNHHSFGFIAFPRRGLQHAAFDVEGRAELLEVIVQMGDRGVKRVDGPGRHGPGNMLFTYCEDPERNLLEWVTEIQQINETSHQPGAWNKPVR